MIKDIDNRTYNEQLHDKGDMPKIRIVYPSKKTNESKGSTYIIAPPTDYDELIRKRRRIPLPLSYIAHDSEGVGGG